MFIGKCERLFEVLKGLYVEIIPHTILSGLVKTTTSHLYKHKFPSGISELRLLKITEKLHFQPLPANPPNLCAHFRF